MNKVIIKTNCSNFTLIDKILEIDQTAICGLTHLETSALYLLIESMAQLGAMHVRYLNDYKNHTFLLKISELTISKDELIKAKLIINGKCIAMSDKSYNYNIKAKTCAEKQIAGGNFLFSTLPYNSEFKKNILKDHYKNLFYVCKKI